MAKFMTPAVTIFKNNKICKEGCEKVYKNLMKGNIDGIVVLGSIGEFFNLSMEEHKEVIDYATEFIKGKTKLVIGTARMKKEETIELSNYAYEKGADAVMIISPYYFKLPDAGIEKYYSSIANEVKADIYLYNFPTLTGYDLKPEIALNLCRKHSNIIGYKDTVSEMGHTRKLINMVLPEFPKFEVYSGFDEFFFSNAIAGGAGCIGGLSNIYPKLFKEWADSFNKKDFNKSIEIQKKVNKLMSLYDVAPAFIPVIKKAMIISGLEINDDVTDYFSKTSEEEESAIREIMKSI